MMPIFPNLFIIGAMKAGTSSLHAYLHQHPQIFMSAFKEPQYFAPHLARGRMWGQGQPYPEPGIGWYLRLFAMAGAVMYAGESSTSYSARHWVGGCAQRIWAFNPAARIVYMLRHPVERAISHYWHFVADGRETLGPEEAVRTRDDYIARSDYAYQLEPYLELFDRDQIFLLTLAELQRDPAGLFRRLFTWLGVDPDVPIDTSEKHNVRGAQLRQARRFARPLVRFTQSWRWQRMKSRLPRPVLDMVESRRLSSRRPHVGADGRGEGIPARAAGRPRRRADQAGGPDVSRMAGVERRGGRPCPARTRHPTARACGTPHRSTTRERNAEGQRSRAGARVAARHARSEPSRCSSAYSRSATSACPRAFGWASHCAIQSASRSGTS